MPPRSFSLSSSPEPLNLAVSVTAPPNVVDGALALNCSIELGGSTTTSTVAVVLPARFVAVSTNDVVVDKGPTVNAELEARPVLPDGSMRAVSSWPSIHQDKVVDAPKPIEAGSA